MSNGNVINTSKLAYEELNSEDYITLDENIVTTVNSLNLYKYGSIVHIYYDFVCKGIELNKEAVIGTHKFSLIKTSYGSCRVRPGNMDLVYAGTTVFTDTGYFRLHPPYGLTQEISSFAGTIDLFLKE